MISVASLFKVFASGVSLVVIAVLGISPSASTAIEATMVTLAVPPVFAISPSKHTTGPVISEHASGELTNVNSPGNGSVTITFVASNTPMLVTV